MFGNMAAIPRLPGKTDTSGLLQPANLELRTFKKKL